VYRYLETLEPSASPKVSHLSASARPPNPLLTLSAQQATWLFFRKEKDLKAEEQENLRQLRQASPEIETVSQLVEKFLRMVRERTGEQLDAWLKEVKDSHLEAFDSFVTGVQQDKDAVFAGLTLPWSNGPLEGNVNRLTLLKRSMSGRAEFDLLKLRVLHRSKKNQDRKDKKKNKQKQQVSRLKKPKLMKSGRNSQPITTGISEVA
jgi:transposase